MTLKKEKTLRHLCGASPAAAVTAARRVQCKMPAGDNFVGDIFMLVEDDIMLKFTRAIVC